MSSKQQEMKLSEAIDFEKQGDKLASRTITRWKPDWDGAVLMYEKAGTSYKNAKVPERAKEAYRKCAAAYEQINIAFSAAKYYELAGQMAKEINNDEETVKFYQKASQLYVMNNSHDKAAEVLVKAAKALEDIDANRALEFCNDACSIFENEEREQFASSTFKYAISLAVKQAKYEQALALMKRYQAILIKIKNVNDLAKLHLSAIIVHLKRDDFVAAERYFQEAMAEGMVGSYEAKAAAELLDAVEKRNPEALQAALQKQTFTFLDHQIIRLSKTLKISGEAPSDSKEELKDESNGLA